MSRFQAEKAARQMLMSGYRHHTYEDERAIYGKIFLMNRDELLQLLYSEQMDDLFGLYAEIIGPTRLRAQKNSLICLISSVCRASIDRGLDVEFSFALSDYYINQLELVADERSLQQMSRDILMHYYDLVQNEQAKAYTQPVAVAVRYIGRNLRGTCTVGEVARHVGLEPHYFTTLFFQQVGTQPGRYIRRRKLEEAKQMIGNMGASITETAESLGFYDVAHFSRCFKQHYGFPPSVLKKQDAPRTGG